MQCPHSEDQRTRRTIGVFCDSFRQAHVFSHDLEYRCVNADEFIEDTDATLGDVRGSDECEYIDHQLDTEPPNSQSLEDTVPLTYSLFRHSFIGLTPSDCNTSYSSLSFSQRRHTQLPSVFQLGNVCFTGLNIGLS